MRADVTNLEQQRLSQFASLSTAQRRQYSGIIDRYNQMMERANNFNDSTLSEADNEARRESLRRVATNWRINSASTLGIDERRVMDIESNISTLNSDIITRENDIANYRQRITELNTTRTDLVQRQTELTEVGSQLTANDTRLHQEDFDIHARINALNAEDATLAGQLATIAQDRDNERRTTTANFRQQITERRSRNAEGIDNNGNVTDDRRHVIAESFRSNRQVLNNMVRIIPQNVADRIFTRASNNLNLPAGITNGQDLINYCMNEQNPITDDLITFIDRYFHGCNRYADDQALLNRLDMNGQNNGNNNNNNHH